MIANYDLMPTLLSYVGLSDKMPTQPRIARPRLFAGLAERNESARCGKTDLL